MAYKEHGIFGHRYEQKSCSIKELVVHNYGHDTLCSYSDVQMKISHTGGHHSCACHHISVCNYINSGTTS